MFFKPKEAQLAKNFALLDFDDPAKISKLNVNNVKKA